MKKWLIILLSILLVGCNQVVSEEQDMGQNSEYYLVDEFLEKYPEELSKSEAFNQMVQKDVSQTIGSTVDKINISVIYPGEQVSDYWRRSVKSFKERMDDREMFYEISEYFTTPGASIADQEEQIRTALKSNPDYLIFTLDAKAHTKIIEQIMDQNETKLILQNITTPLRRWASNQPFMYVGFDHKIGSEMLAADYIEMFDSATEYGLLYFTEGYVSEMRGDTFISYMESNSDFKLMASYYTDGNREKAKLSTLDMIEDYPNIKFIYACSTDVALGAIDALKEKGLIGDILVNGWGGGSSELDSILSSELYMTVMRMNDDNGVAMADAIYMDLLGQTDGVPTVYSGEFMMVNQSTSQTELEDYIERAFRYSD